MTLNLTELRDEPLGTPKSAMKAESRACWTPLRCLVTDTEMALGDAADDESVFKFDVEGLGDEALDPLPHVSALSAGMPPPAGWTVLAL